MIRATRRAVNWDGRLSFGKHKGKPIALVPRDYLLWVISCDWLDDASAHAISQFLDLDQPQDDASDAEPPGELASVVVPRLTWLWWQRVSARHAGDLSAMAVLGEALDDLGEICSTYTGCQWRGLEVVTA